jgi:hypothetical protein
VQTIESMARPEGFEPPTLCLEGRRSVQLSYGRILVVNRLRREATVFQATFGWQFRLTHPARLHKVFQKSRAESVA